MRPVEGEIVQEEVFLLFLESRVTCEHEMDWYIRYDLICESWSREDTDMVIGSGEATLIDREEAIRCESLHREYHMTS